MATAGATGGVPGDEKSLLLIGWRAKTMFRRP